MVELHVLEAFDALLWLRSALAVENRYGVSEATTSRYRKRCLQLFDLAMERRQGEWELIGDTSLLERERQVHQQARWRGYRPLRLEATYWSAPLLEATPLPGWLLGVSNIVGVGRYRRDLWEGRAEQELVVGYGTSLSLAVSGENLRRLPLQLPFTSGDALVVRREHGAHPRLRALLEQLHCRYAPAVRQHADVSFDPEFLDRLAG